MTEHSEPPPTGHACPNCGRQVDDHQRICPWCGYDPEAGTRQKPNYVLLMLLLAATPIVFCGSCFLSLGVSMNRPNATDNGSVILFGVPILYVVLVIGIWFWANWSRFKR